MEGKIDMDSILDYAILEASSFENSFKALAFSEGVVETLAFGHLDMLALHLPQANECFANGKCFMLQPNENIKDLSWFTKSTLARFLHLITMPGVLKSANAIEREMSQLEDTRRFQLTLYSKDHHNLSTVTPGVSIKDATSMQMVKQEVVPSDVTKNELLRAMDLRLMTLKEELVAVLNRATGVTLSVKLLSDLAAFSEHFEVRELRDPLMKWLSLMPKDQKKEGSMEKVNSDGPVNSGTEDTCQPVSVIGKEIPLRNGISPAKIAQAERQSSTESESSESSDEDQTVVERSRLAIRSASPRRSASPMRRIQIGRSGSRRSTALSIKSLNYFPVREKTVSYRDASENGSGGEESEQPSKKPDNNVRRMSVQDAISLFESKQKDQTSDIQKKRASAEASFNINKSVLRRWSSGMGDSLVHSQENASDATPKNNSTNVETEAGEHKLSGVKAESDSLSNGLDTVAAAEILELSGADNTATPSEDTPESLLTSQNEKVNDKTNTSAEWTKQKEAELNQMLMKMMESKPGRYQSLSASYDRKVAIPNELKGGLYSQYKEKRDEKLRSENVGKHSMMEAQFKVLQETLEQTKAGVASKSGAITKKLNSSTVSQKPRRNSAPPVLPKKEVPKAAVSRKPSSKQSTPPSTRASWSSGPLPKANGTQPTKSSPKVTSHSSTPTRQKTQLAQTGPKPERPLRQPKGNQAEKVNIKPNIKDQEEKKQKSTTKSNRSMKVQSVSKGDSSPATAKPSLYNKVTKKSSVVPVEAKPFLKKGSGIGPGVLPVPSKTKASRSEDLPKNNGNLVQAEEKKLDETVETTTQVLDVDPLQEANEVDASVEIPPDNDLNLDKTENLDQSIASEDNSFKNSEELPLTDFQPEEDIGISSAAWVDVEHQEVSAACDTGPSEDTGNHAPPQPEPSSPRIRHSLSQMLQADCNEPEIIEWGNAENPPAIVYQKDAPKGLKRLLKFARKNKPEANVTGCASPSVFSEGEDDTDDTKSINKKNVEISRKSILQTKGFGQQKSILNESLDGGNSSKRTVEYQGVHDDLSASLNSGNPTCLSSDKLREGHVSSTVTSAKATRSFFSLSTFRSSKSSEAKLR